MYKKGNPEFKETLKKLANIYIYSYDNKLKPN